MANFVIQFPLKTEKYQEDKLNKRFEIGRQIYNALVNITQKRYKEMVKTKRYRGLMSSLTGDKKKDKEINDVNYKCFTEDDNNYYVFEDVLEVNERLIKQLHEVGITDISIVVGFMKESYEYLIDKYHVNLIVNTAYAEKNNLHSLALIADKIHNSYIIPCDIWCETNPFNKDELGSWYMVSDLIDDYSYIRINRKSELVKSVLTDNYLSLI